MNTNEHKWNGKDMIMTYLKLLFLAVCGPAHIANRSACLVSSDHFIAFQYGL